MATILNGRLPATMLATIPWAPGVRVTHAVLVDLVAMNAAYRTEFGRDLVINEGYRDLATQVAYKARTKLPRSDPRWLGSAATPGTSKHGWGEAVDFGKVGGFDSETYAWLEANAARFGFYQPPQYREGGAHPEFWHWEHPSDTAVTQRSTPTPAQEDDVALTPAQEKALAAIPKILGIVTNLETKARRHDLLFLYFSTPDHRPAIAQPGSGWWAIAPSLAARDKQREIARMLGLVVEGTSVKDWEDVVGQVLGTAPNGDVVLDPEGFIELRDWPLYPGGNLHPASPEET